MKNSIMLFVLAVLSLCSGCAHIGGWYLEHKDELRVKIKTHVENKIHNHIDIKIDKLVTDNKITDEYAAELKDSLKSAVTKYLDNFCKEGKGSADAVTSSNTDK